jgi:hypothetical protein
VDADEEPMEDDDLLDDEEGDAGNRESKGDVSLGANAGKGTRSKGPRSEFLRAPNEDDDGYDPYSDRPARREPLFERDPWD